MAKQKLFKFGVKNLKAAFKDELGAYGTPIDIAYAEAISLESTRSEKPLFGDGIQIDTIVSEKGKTGTITVVNVEEAYEIECGRAMSLGTGTFAEIAQQNSIEHAIYYETEALKDGVKITIKNWLFNCLTGKASETFQQSKEDPTINTYEHPLTVLGVNLLQSGTGTADYLDENGVPVLVFRLTCYPDAAGYATFQNTVPTPRKPA